MGEGMSKLYMICITATLGPFYTISTCTGISGNSCIYHVAGTVRFEDCVVCAASLCTFGNCSSSSDLYGRCDVDCKVTRVVVTSFLQLACMRYIKFVGINVRGRCLINEIHEHLYPRNIPAIRYL